MDGWLRKRKKPDGPLWCARPLTLYVKNAPSRAPAPSATKEEAAAAIVEAAPNEEHLRLLQENRRLLQENRRLTELNQKLVAACARVCVTSNHVSALAVELLNDN